MGSSPIGFSISKIAAGHIPQHKTTFNCGTLLKLLKCQTLLASHGHGMSQDL